MPFGTIDFVINDSICANNSFFSTAQVKSASSLKNNFFSPSLSADVTGVCVRYVSVLLLFQVESLAD